MAGEARERSAVYQIADDYVERAAALNPLLATSIGVPGHDDAMPDLSPAGEEERAAFDRETLHALHGSDPADERDRIARDMMVERLELSLALHEQGEHLRTVRILGSPVQSVRSTFDLMPKSTAEDWERVAKRMCAVPAALAGIREALELGVERGTPGSRRQALAVTGQARTWAGSAGTPSFFETLVAACSAGEEVVSPALLDDLRDGARLAAAAYAAFGDYLEQRYAPRASERDVVEPERYALHARTFNGAELDLLETYRWGWSELALLESELAMTAGRIAPRRPVAEVRGLLDAGEAGPIEGPRVIEGVEAFRRWMQELQYRTVDEMDGRHFDIPEPVRRIEAMIAPPGGALAMYYTGPSEDFSRPGRTWYPADGRTRFPLWPEVSVAYHEGVPGHHLQIAMARYLAGELSRFQRLMGSVSGYVEGWALYAERLMAELGYLEEPAFRLGMLVSQVFRAARVVVDIGLHLELTIPRDAGFHAGERWDPQLALEFMVPRSPFDERFARSEIDRYLGMPGQAISYKVGERFWVAARAAARARDGAEFDLKQWHRRALSLGPMGLDQLRRELGG